MEQKSSEIKSLLIIKSHAQGLGPAEGFLKNRDWNVKSTANLKEALIHLVQNQPQFVMISIDHPNRKVRNLPKVLAQAFPCCVIAFSETASAANMKILSETSAEYAIFPPVTGPAIERTVNKYYKDMQTKGLTPHSRNGKWDEESGDGKSGMIAIKGAGGSGSESAHNLLSQFLAGDDNGTAVGGSDADLAAALAAAGQVAALGSVMSGSTAGTAHGSDNSQRHGDYYSNPFADTDEPRPIEYDPRAAKSGGPGWTPLPQTEKRKEHPGPETDESKTPLPGQDSLISQGAKDALEKSCINFTEQPAELAKTTNVACILVESVRFSGYLIAAMAKDRNMDLAFVEKVRGRLFRFLRDKGETVQDNDNSMTMKIREVPFEDWALAQADFLRKSVHNGEEIAMAFFLRENLRAKTLECDDSEMTAISISEFAANVPVEFNVYIYLPRNNKYLLYTPCGSVFFSNQKDRLVNQGVSHLHILKLEMAGLDKYRAQNFLNDKIQEFESREKPKVLV